MKVGDMVVRDGESLTREWLEFCHKNDVKPTDPVKVTGVSTRSGGLYFFGGDEYWNRVKFFQQPTGGGSGDAVTSPAHYQVFPDLEAIQVIASSLTLAEFRGYCLGNRLKYRLRAGNKDKLEQDIKKSDYYIELYEKHKHLCCAVSLTETKVKS